MAPAVAPDQFVHTLYREHHGWLHAWLGRKLDNSFDAADIAHDTFLRILTKGFSAAGSEPRALLTHIAKGIMVDRWRRHEVERAYAESAACLGEAVLPSEEQRLIIIEALMRIDDMLKSMSEKTRTIFLLAQLDGLTYAEIAAEMDTTLVTVKRHMRRAFIACLSLA